MSLSWTHCVVGVLNKMTVAMTKRPVISKPPTGAAGAKKSAMERKAEFSEENSKKPNGPRCDNIIAFLKEIHRRYRESAFLSAPSPSPE